MKKPAAGVALASRAPLRVLIVEDTAADAELMIAVLKRAGYSLAFDVVEAPKAFQQRLEQADYDIILSDHNLRTWTGTEALEMLRRSGKDIPFVPVTATLGDEAAVQYIKSGAADYVLKHRLERLPVVVAQVLRERAHREEAARLQEQILCAKRDWELTFDSVPDPVLLLDEQCRVIRANRAAVQVLGVEFSELVGKPCYEVLHGTAPPQLNCPHERLLASGCEERGDFEEPRLGKVFDITSTPLRDSRGVLRGCVQVMHDITERKTAEQALRESETHFRRLVENASYGIFLSDPAGRFLDVNPALVEILGYASRDEVLTLDMAADVYRHPEDRARIVEEAQRSGGVQGREVEWKRKDGKAMLVRLSGRAVRDLQGKAESFEVIVEDITERRALEKQNRQLQKFEAIGQMAGGIAHDFNNVIGAIMGWAELSLEEASPGSRLHLQIKKIRDQAERAAGLTRQLLAFARRQILEPRDINVNQAVADVLSLLEKTIEEHIEVKTVLAAEPPIARADPAQLEQILVNLCLNARDAMAQGGGQLIIETRCVTIGEEYRRLHPYTQPGRFVLLSVSDTGAGMDAATQERIFEPFFTTKEPGKGTGLGLATVYGIVKQHGGFVHVYSEPGHGTTFRVYLPAAPIGVGVQNKAKEPAEPVRGGTETILVVEDHDGLREMARQTLEKLGYHVMLAGDGAEAVEIYQAGAERIALVLLDVVLPKLRGPDAYARMCAVRPDVPAIFATGYSTETELLQSFVQNGVVVLQKPYSPELLARRVREVLDRSAKK